MRRRLTLACVVLAVVGLGVSIAIHVSTFLGVNPAYGSPAVFLLLHLGIFVVFVPAIFAMNRAIGSRTRTRIAWKEIPAPSWMKILCGFFLAYAAVNFFAPFPMGGSPRECDGRYQLSNHGRHIRDLTEQEYQALRVREVRGFSGHWMLFYAAAAMMLYASTRNSPAMAVPPPVPPERGEAPPVRGAGFPLGMVGTVEASGTVNAPSFFAAIAGEVESAGGKAVLVGMSTLRFHRGSFGARGTRASAFLAASSGEIELVPLAARTAVRYTLRFEHLLGFSLVGIGFIGIFLLLSTGPSLSAKVGILASMWLWLVGANYLVTRSRVRKLLREASERAAVSATAPPAA